MALEVDAFDAASLDSDTSELAADSDSTGSTESELDEAELDSAELDSAEFDDFELALEDDLDWVEMLFSSLAAEADEELDAVDSLT